MQDVSEAHDFLWGQSSGYGVEDPPCEVVNHPRYSVLLGDYCEEGEPQFWR